MKSYFLKSILCIALLYATSAFAQTASNRRVHLSGDTVSMHFTVYQYFPFIEADINGVPGKLMFDTGAQSSIEIDDKKVPLKNGKVVGKGFVGSGQSFQTSRYDTVETITLGRHLSFTNAGPVTGHDFNYMKNITTEILGLVGYNFFEGYIFKIDYRKGLISFYKNTPERTQNKDFLKNEKVIAVLDFETRKLPNHPVIAITSSTDTLAVSFDTGQIGTMGLTEATQKRWTEAGSLEINDGSNLATIKSLKFPGGFTAGPFKATVIPAKHTSAANNAIGITEANSITLGYSFLSQYKTVWDYPNHKIYLLER